MEPPAAPLDLLKALGDNTRYAIYLELARSPLPLSTAEVAEALDLHVNTVRPQMERMREVGLLEVSADHRGSPGRPQHRYAVAADAPSLGLEPPTFPMLARMLVGAATRAGATAADALAAGYEQGVDEAEAESGRVAARLPCTDAVVGLLARLGFDPEAADGGDGTTTVAFARCPFQAYAEEQPELICSLHRGLVEGYADARGGAVVAFSTLVDRDPCRVQLSDR